MACVYPTDMAWLLARHSDHSPLAAPEQVALPEFEAMLEKLVGPALFVPGENMTGAAREVRDELDRKIAKLDASSKSPSA